MEVHVLQDQLQQQAGKARHGLLKICSKPYLSFATGNTAFPSQKHVKFLWWI